MSIASFTAIPPMPDTAPAAPPCSKPYPLSRTPMRLSPSHAALCGFSPPTCGSRGLSTTCHARTRRTASREPAEADHGDDHAEPDAPNERDETGRFGRLCPGNRAAMTVVDDAITDDEALLPLPRRPVCDTSPMCYPGSAGSAAAKASRTGVRTARSRIGAGHSIGSGRSRFPRPGPTFGSARTRTATSRRPAVTRAAVSSTATTRSGARSLRRREVRPGRGRRARAATHPRTREGGPRASGHAAREGAGGGGAAAG